MTLHRDPSELGEFPCTKCNKVFLALFLLIKHMRDEHNDRLAPLAGRPR